MKFPLETCCQWIKDAEGKDVCSSSLSDFEISQDELHMEFIVHTVNAQADLLAALARWRIVQVVAMRQVRSDLGLQIYEIHSKQR